MKKKIIFSAGGTGGHIFPAVNLMKHFSDKGYTVLLVTDIRGKNFIEQHSEFKSYILKADTFANKKFLNKIFSFFSILYSIIQSIIILKNEKPDLVFGFGGYVSFPISFTAKLFNLPLFIYENNIILGRANRYLLLFAKKVFLAKKIIKNYPKKYENKIHIAGSILSKNIINHPDIKKAKKIKNFSILILGGSQGAQIFGIIVPQAIKMIKEEGYEVEIIQQCTSEQKNSIKNFYNNNNIKSHVFEFERNILKLLMSSNLAITRCGASTTAELIHTLTPFIAVPLPKSADNHQYLNAKYYANKGCCLLLEQDNFNVKNLFNLIMENLKNKNKLESMCENMKKNYEKNVYDYIENKTENIF